MLAALLMFETAPRISLPALLIGNYTDPAGRDEAVSLLDELGIGWRRECVGRKHADKV